VLKFSGILEISLFCAIRTIPDEISKPGDFTLMLAAQTRRNWLINLVLLVALTLVLGSVRHYRDDIHPANEAARIYAAMAIVDHGTVALDPVFDELDPGWRLTGQPPNRDVSKFNGRYLLDKAPGLTLAAVPVIAALRFFNLDLGFGDLAWLLALMFCALPTAAFAVFLQNFVRKQGMGPPWLSVALVLATPWIAYGGMFFGHAPAAVLIGFGAILGLGPLVKDGGKTTRGNAFLAGLSLGLGVLVELPAAFLAVFITVAVIADRRSRTKLGWFIAGAALPAIMLFGWNYINFGSPLTMAYGHKQDAAFAVYHSQGLFGISWPKLTRLWGIIFSPQRGLLFLAPWLAVGFMGAIYSIFDGKITVGWRIALATGALGFPLIMAGFVDWMAGDSMGPRHLLVSMPFIGIGVSRGYTLAVSEAQMKWLHGVSIGLVISSFLMCAVGAWVFPYFGQNITNPLFEVATPVMLEAGFLPTIWGRLSMLPVVLALALVSAIIFWFSSGFGNLKRHLAFMVIIPIVTAAIHIGTASIPSSEGKNRQILQSRAMAFELMGRDDLADTIRTALRKR